MDSSTFDAQIKQANEKSENLRSELEQIREEYVQAVQRYLPQWYREQIEGSVTSNPSVSKGLGHSGLASLKAELNEAVEHLPPQIESELKKPQLWPHLSNFTVPTYPHSSMPFDFMKKYSEARDEVLRTLLGGAGALLIKYGFDKPGRDSLWERQDTKHLRYRYGYSVSSEMGSAISSYSELLKKYWQARVELAGAEKAKAEAEAKSLWDQA